MFLKHLQGLNPKEALYGDVSLSLLLDFEDPPVYMIFLFIEFFFFFTSVRLDLGAGYSILYTVAAGAATRGRSITQAWSPEGSG